MKKVLSLILAAILAVSVTSVNAATVAQLKAQLQAANVAFPKNAKKAELEKLVAGLNNGSDTDSDNGSDNDSDNNSDAGSDNGSDDKKDASKAVLKLNQENENLARFIEALANLEAEVAAKEQIKDLEAKIKDASKDQAKDLEEELAALKKKATRLSDKAVEAKKEGLNKEIEAATKKRNAARAQLSAKDIVTEHPYITAAAVSSVVLVLTAITYRKELTPAIVKAMAWMKANKATSMAIIAGIVVAGSAAFIYYNTPKDADVMTWTNVKHAGSVALNGIKAVPSNIKDGAVAVYDWSMEHKLVAAGIATVVIGGVFVAYDLGSENSALKSLVSSVYDRATSKTVAKK